MEKEQRVNRMSFRKKLLLSAGATVLTFLLSGVVGGDNAEGVAPYKSTSYKGPLTLVVPSETARPIHISDRINAERKTDLPGENRDNSPGGINAVDVFPSPSVIPPPESRLSPQEQKIQDLQNETAQYVQIAQESGRFSDKEIADIKMYAPICIPPARERDIIWEACMVTIEEETGASDSIKAFNGQTSPYYGIAQRNVLIWPESYVADAAKGLEYLAKFPQRHPDDWKEIAAMTKMLADNLHNYESTGKNNALFLSLKLFTGSEELARQRLDRILQMEQVLKLKNPPDPLQKIAQ